MSIESFASILTMEGVLVVAVGMVVMVETATAMVTAMGVTGVTGMGQVGTQDLALAVWALRARA